MFLYKLALIIIGVETYNCEYYHMYMLLISVDNLLGMALIRIFQI